MTDRIRYTYNSLETGANLAAVEIRACVCVGDVRLNKPTESACRKHHQNEENYSALGPGET